MYYSETKVILGGLVHVPILIFIVNLINSKFEALAAKVVEVKEEGVKVAELKASEVKEEEVKVAEAKASEVKEEEVKVAEAKASEIKDDEG